MVKKEEWQKLDDSLKEKKTKLDATKGKIAELKKLEKEMKKEISQEKIKKERADERRRDALVGVMFRNKAKNDPVLHANILKELDSFYTRDSDRELFSLPPLLPISSESNPNPESVVDENTEAEEENAEKAPEQPTEPTTQKRPDWMPDGKWNGIIYNRKDGEEGRAIYIDRKAVKITIEQAKELRTLFPQKPDKK